MFEKDGSAGTLRPIIMVKCGFGGARPPGEPPSMTQPCFRRGFNRALQCAFVAAPVTAWVLGERMES